MMPVRVTEKRIITVSFPKTITVDFRIVIVLMILLTGCSATLLYVSPQNPHPQTEYKQKRTAEVKEEVDTLSTKKEEIPLKQKKGNKKKVERTDNDLLSWNPNVTIGEDGIPRLYGCTPYEILIHHLKSHESFRSGEYPDGQYNSKGFGLNLSPEHVRWASKLLGFPARSRRWTIQEAKFLLEQYCSQMLPELKRQYPNCNSFQIVALVCHKYNTGNTIGLHNCCGAKKGCRRGLESHRIRRNFEVALFNGTITKSMLDKDKRESAKIRSW